MSKTVAAEAAVETKKNDAPAKRKTVTNWRIFEEAGFLPARIKCDGYKGHHPSDMSCHTAFPPTTENVLRHADPAHSGGWFRIKFRVSDKKTSPLWRELEEAGQELKEFWCPHCRENVELSPRRIMFHLAPHPGANRVNLDPQVLCMWIGQDEPPQVDDESGLYE